ncbi:unnamed protein product, partial [Nesidiocoris tenuis]
INNCSKRDEKFQKNIGGTGRLTPRFNASVSRRRENARCSAPRKNAPPSKWKYWNRPKIEYRNGASEKTFIYIYNFKCRKVRPPDHRLPVLRCWRQVLVLVQGNEKFKPPPDLTPPLHLFPPTVRPLHPAPTNRKTQDNSYKDSSFRWFKKFFTWVLHVRKLHYTLTMRPDSYIFDLWKAPPIKLYIKVFVFNITNAHEFMAGIDHKLKVEEVGPYTYSEKLENTNVSFFDNDTLSFNPVRKIIFEKELSVGDPYRDIVTVTNIPLLGLASMMHNSSIGMSLMLSTLISYMDAQPLLTLPVDSFLWGYDDPLVKLARRTVPAWINFERFGLLDRMIDEGNYRVNMYLKKTEDSDQFMVSTINGSPGLKNWGYDSSSNRTSKCNSARGTTEGYLMPANLQPNSSFTIFRRAFCRPLPFVYVGQEITRQGYRAFRYSFPDNILDPDNPDNKCYCKKDGCLKRGLSDLSPCYYSQ